MDNDTKPCLIHDIQKQLRLLFIGNSHTYCNNLPAFVKLMAQEDGFSCSVTMLAHGGWTLEQHVREPEGIFNIQFGMYDYVVIQEHSHPMADEEKYASAAKQLCNWAYENGARPVIFATWSTKSEPQKQPEMNDLNRRIALANKALLAPVGESWWAYANSWPKLDLYADDGQHASAAGSEFAAKVIWQTIRNDYGKTR